MHGKTSIRFYLETNVEMASPCANESEGFKFLLTMDVC